MLSHRGFSVAGRLARRTLVACATTALIASTALTPIAEAFAQSSQNGTSQAGTAQQPYPGPPITAQTTAADPPARVGRIAKMNGTVSFHTADEDQWGPATLNYPLTAGNALWTEPGARAELQIGSANRLVMDSGTELNVANLDDTRFEANLPQGTAYLNLNDVAPGDSYAIKTPRGTVQISEPGRYVIAAGDDNTPTTVTALEGGKAQLGERGLNQAVPAGQTATLTGPLDDDDPIKAALAPQQPQTAFVQSVLAEEKAPQQAAAPAPTPAQATPNPNIAQNAWPARSAPASVPSAAAPAAMPVAVQGMTGAQDMAAYGSWSTAPDYGSVWYPPVETGWVPYRHGHWAYVQPWGWTWVADEPWGFAPFHYGRWVMVRDRWAWSPGDFHRPHHHRHPRPVYAPALVAFFGSAGGVSVSITAGNVGWVPLGWREPYYPPYRVSRNYIRNVNVTHVTNITKVTNVTNVNNVTVNRYVNRNSVTVVNRDVMRNSQPVQRSLQTVDRRQVDSARIDRRAQIQPTAATAGMSPQTAQRMGIQNEGRDNRRQAAPGPQIRQADLQRNDMQRNQQLRNDQRQPQALSSRDQRQPQQQQQRMEQPRQQENRNAAAAPAPRQMSREQAAQPGNARQFDQTQQRQSEQRARSRNDERPQVQTEAQPQQQQQRAEQARQQQQNAQRHQQEAQRQQMQQRQQAEQQGRQRQEQQQMQRQQGSQRQQQMQQQREAQQRQQHDAQRQAQQQQAQQQQRQQQESQRQAQQQNQQRQQQQEVRRQQEAQAESQRQQRREQQN